MKKPSKPTYTLQVKAVTVVDVEIVAESLVQAVELGNTMKITDVMTYEPKVTENDSKVTVVGIWSHEQWGTD
jgi:hypothetical protein